MKSLIEIKDLMIVDSTSDCFLVSQNFQCRTSHAKEGTPEVTKGQNVPTLMVKYLTSECIIDLTF